jgi:hypothetical protein
MMRMISRRGAKKQYSSATPVVHKGDAGWTSDRPDRQGESYGTNPMATVRHRRNPKVIVPVLDPARQKVGRQFETDDGRDVWLWEVVEKRDLKRRAYAHIDGVDSPDDVMRVWKLKAVYRNAAL